MSEGVLIALITSIGALFGGIASAIIVAYATVRAAEKKQSSLQVSTNNIERNYHWSWGVFSIGAIVGGIVLFGIAAFAGFLPITFPSISAVPLYRYHNLFSGDYVYTTNRNANLDEWIFEGNEGFVYTTEQNGTVPLYEFYNQEISQHFYTTNKTAEGSNDLKLQGVVGYVYSEQITNTVPLYRYFNGSNGAHFYTVDFGELGGGKKGFIYEEIECYVFAKAP